MSFDIETVTSSWNRIDREKWSRLPKSIEVGPMPPFPLARAVKMPEEKTGFSLGSLALRLKDLTVASSRNFIPTLESATLESGRLRACFCFGKASVRGRHALEGTQVWDAGIDGAGTGLAFDEDGRVRHPGGNDTNKHPTWIETANKQRDKLIEKGGPNGQTAVDTYTNHREAFTDLMTTGQAAGYVFQGNWGTPAVSEMAGDTNDNLTTNTTDPINHPTKKYGATNYNGNAAMQQLNVITGLKGMEGATTDEGSLDPASKYAKALTATLNFKGGVLQNTKAKKIDDIPPKNQEEVYGMVQGGEAAPEVTVEQASKLIDGEEIGGRAPDGSAWSMMLSADERAYMRNLEAKQQEHRDRLAAARPILIVEDALEADIPEFYLYLEFEIAEDGSLIFADARVELDRFNLELADDAWPELLGKIAREELGKARFLKSLVHDRVADALERDLVESVVGILTESL